MCTPEQTPARRTWRLWERPATPRPFQLTERDVALVREIFRHRFMRPAQLRAFLGGSHRKIANRLTVLWQHRYLERPRALRPTRLLMEELVYGLGPEGAPLLARLDPSLRRIANLDWAETPRTQVGWPYVDHQCGVTDVMVSLAVAARGRGIMLEWDGHGNRRRHRLAI